MHLENASVELVELEIRPAEEVDPDVGVDAVGELGLVGELEPHAATVVAAANAAAAVRSQASRSGGVRRSCMWSPSGCPRSG
jgi:hypothetical protein